MQTYYNPFSIKLLDNGWKCLSVKVKDVAENVSVDMLLKKRFGSFSMFRSIPKSKLYFCHFDTKLNLYQVSLIYGVCTIHVLRMYDETRLDQDIDSIISVIRDSTPIYSYISLSVYMYLPYMMNVDVSSLLKVFRPSGQKDTDIHGNTLCNRTKLYTCKWPLRHTISTLGSSESASHKPSTDASSLPVQVSVATSSPTIATQTIPVQSVATTPQNTTTPAPPVFTLPNTPAPPPVFGAPNTTTAPPVFGATTNTTAPCFANTTFSFGSTKK